MFRPRRSLAHMTTETRPLCAPLCLHVYRVGGIWGDDKIVRADDRKTLRYHAKGTRLTGTWQFTLHLGGPNGVVVCHVKSPYLSTLLISGGPGPIRITMGSGTAKGHVVQVQLGTRGSEDGTYMFQGLDDVEYRWKPVSRVWGNKLECRNSRDEVVATYRTTPLAISKDGELRIHEPALFMTDLLVATCLAMRTPDH